MTGDETPCDHVVLTGRLICRDEREAAVVEHYLPGHLAATRAEAGCVSFTVVPTADPRVWQVAETFVDAAAFAAHQRRAAASEWGRATRGIRRDYTMSAMRDGRATRDDALG